MHFTDRKPVSRPGSQTRTPDGDPQTGPGRAVRGTFGPNGTLAPTCRIPGNRGCLGRRGPSSAPHSEKGSGTGEGPSHAAPPPPRGRQRPTEPRCQHPGPRPLPLPERGKCQLLQRDKEPFLQLRTLEAQPPSHHRRRRTGVCPASCPTPSSVFAEPDRGAEGWLPPRCWWLITLPPLHVSAHTTAPVRPGPRPGRPSDQDEDVLSARTPRSALTR